MSLTGLTLIALTFFGTAAVAAATIWGWNRGRSLRFVLRPLGVLLIESLLLFSIGLVVNRQEDFYPSWTALFDPGKPAVPTYHTAAGGLDIKITAQAGGKGALPQLIAWRPAEWGGWRLATAPTVVVPAGYSQHPQWRYSVVLVVAQTGQGWPKTWQRPAELSVAAGATRDVVVFVTATAKTAMPAVTSQLPDDLRHDLRVTDHRWAVVTAPANAGVVQRAVLAAPGQYPAIAVVRTRPATAREEATTQSRPPETGPITAFDRQGVAGGLGRGPPLGRCPRRRGGPAGGDRLRHHPRGADRDRHPDQPGHRGALGGRADATATGCLLATDQESPKPLRLDTECTNLVGSAQSETFLTQDVPAYARSHLRVRSDQSGWGLIGFSAGAYCATDLLLRHPGQYAAAASLSGYVSPGIRVGDGSEHTTYNLLWRLQHLPIPAVALYLTCAKSDVAAYNATIAIAKAAHNPLSLTTAYITGGGHSSQSWKAMEAPAFDWLSTWLGSPAT